ncbi:MAG TPA: MraY family glycosyltransferase [Geobacteraceae bacterium]|nr:MraY family glycosyltransferase [Geobacteraceae bacterium]
MIFLSTLLLSVLLTIALIPLLSGVALRVQLVDIPNDRKVHLRPIPRIGGFAMALGAFIPIILWHNGDWFVRAYLAGAGILVLFGLADDFRELSPMIKFTGQILAALIAIFLGGVEIRSLGMLLPDNLLLPEYVAVPLTLLAIVGVTNAINLSDGLDGLAGGISLLIFAGIGYLAYLDDNAVIGLIALALSGVIFGFLRFNTHPASIFMGDAGSQFLGFSAITLSLALTQGHPTPLSPVLPLILLGFPVLDTLTVMTTRIAHGTSPFTADKNHFHHNLMDLGFLHPESVLIIYFFQTVLLLAAVFFRFYSDWLLLSGYLIFSAMIIFGFSYAARTKRRVKRFDFFDIKIAGRLRVLKRDGTVIRPSFRIFEFGIPLLLFVTCLVTDTPPGYISVICAVMAALVLFFFFRRRNSLPKVLRPVLYLLIPFAVYLSDPSRVVVAGIPLERFYNGSFGVFAVLLILVTKFSRREKGFHSTPMDFLIIILALVAPNLPDQKMQEYQLGLTAARIIMLYFSFEVLLAELRGKFDRIALATVASLVALAIRV